MLELSTAPLPDTFIAEKPEGRINDQLDPTAPFARLKSSNTGVVGARDTFTTGPTTADEAAADPALLLAVTATAIVEPKSPLTNVYDEPTAPAIAEQFAPPLSQRCHAYANVGAGDPDQLPDDAVNT